VAPNFSRSFSGQHVIAKKRKKKIEETDEEQGKSLLITGLEKKKKSKLGMQLYTSYLCRFGRSSKCLYFYTNSFQILDESSAQKARSACDESFTIAHCRQRV
jgi:alanine-alpha-ketoisovalerate/valine-pyruvate aminotransferase